MPKKKKIGLAAASKATRERVARKGGKAGSSKFKSKKKSGKKKKR